MELNEEKRDVEMELNGSHFDIYQKEGVKEVVRKFRNEACYSRLWGGWMGMTRLKLIFPKNPDESTKECVTWILSSDLFGDAFITKDFEEGMAEGFEIDLDQPTNFLFSAFAAIRMPWEAGHHRWGACWFFKNFLEAGFSARESFFLSCLMGIEKNGLLYGSDYNTNHLPFPRTLKYKDCVPERFARQEGTLAKGSRSKGVTESWGVAGWDYFHEGLTGMSLTNPETIEKINKELLGK